MESLAFKLYINYTEPRFNQNEKVNLLLGTIALVCLMLTIYYPNDFTLGMAFVLLLIIGFSRMMSFFLIKEHNKEYLGQLVFSTDNITWSNQIIKWSEMTSIKIDAEKVLDALEVSNDLSNDRSNGINTIEIYRQNQAALKGIFEIRRTPDLSKLKELFRYVVESKQVNFDVAKELIKPHNYKAIQDLKKQFK